MEKMNRIAVVSAVMLMMSVSVHAQSDVYTTIMDVTEQAVLVEQDASAEFPYSKVLFATDSDLKAQRFKLDSYRNCWNLTHTNGWGVVASILTDVNTPVTSDYRILVQNGEGGGRSFVQVTFFDPEIYHTIINFGKENSTDFDENKVGKGARYKFTYAGYSFTLEYSIEEVKVTRTTTGSSDNSKVSTSRSSTEDYSYDKYVYTISTGVPAESDYLKDKALRDAKRAAKGKKARSSETFL